jgi:VWFA-related protein
MRQGPMMAKSFRTMHKVLIFLFCISAITAGSLLAADKNKSKKAAAKPAPASEPKEPVDGGSFVIKMDVDLVTTDVSLMGTPKASLQSEDFILYDNETEQEIAFFSQDQLPLAIALNVDASESIREYLPMLQIAAYSTLRRLKSEDQVALSTFNSTRSRLADLTEDRSEIAEKLGKIKINWGTNIYDSLYDSAIYLQAKAPRRRRAIILVSDNCHVIMGGETYHGKDAVRTELLEGNTLLYDIKTPGGVCYDEDANIRRIVELTGGIVIDVHNPEGIQPALKQIVNHLRKQYTLGFNPTAPGEKGSFHKLAIKLKNDKACSECRIVTRAGYYSGVHPPAPQAEDSKDKKKKIEDPEKLDQELIQRSILAAGAYNFDLPGIQFNVKPVNQIDSAGQPQVKLDLAIPGSGITFEDVDSKHACKMRVVVFYAKENGKILGSDWKIIEGSLSNDAYNRIAQNNYPYSVTVPMKEPTQMIKIVLFDEKSDRIGTKVFLVQQDVPTS